MIVTFTPQDGDRQRWEFAPRRIRSREAERVEVRYGANWDTFVSDVHSGSMKARRVLLWHLLRRDHPALRWDDVPDFCTGELLVELSADELRYARDKAASNPDIDPSVLDQLLAVLDEQIANAPAAEDEQGKANAPSGG